jgi:group I intron endonuclease
MKIYYLYKITNTTNGKIYIGQSVNPRSRWYSHKKEAEREVPRMVIARAIKKYGSPSFLFELIACCRNQDDANEIETELVRQYDSRNSDKGYNIALGGMNAPKTEEWKQKISQALMGHEVSQETRDKVSKGNTGKVRSEEFKKGVSAFHAGKEVSEETRQLLSEINLGNQNCLGKQNALGYKHTQEAKQRIADAVRGRTTIHKGRTWKLVDGKRVWVDR